MTKINRSVIESYLACHYKAFLKLTEPNPRSLTGGNSRFRLAKVDVNHQRRVKHQAPYLIEITSSYLSKGETLILDGVFETDLLSLHIEGLQRVAGSSDIGNFHYVPCVTQEGDQAHDPQRVLLDVAGVVLSRLQGRLPAGGIIWRGDKKVSTVRLSPGLKRGERILNALKELQRAEQPPMLNLNRHCQVCEYQRRCHTQAIGEDNLSLLRGISEAEMGRLRKKGIFTINQLSYTFRPRRIKKRAKNPAHPHYFALQARALREKTVFVHGSPKLDTKGGRIYMDLEGIPTNRSYYLIGLLVTHTDGIHQKSFWADEDDGEAQIFMEMLDYIRPYRDYTVLHYGAYEARALRRMQTRLPVDYAEQIEHMLKHMVNVLSVIRPHIYFPVYSNSLKEIAEYLGHKWSATNASGVQALLWRQRWVEAHDQRMKDELVSYNMEDCRGLKIVAEFIDQVSQHQNAAPGTQTAFTHTEHFEREVAPRGKFGKKEFMLDEFDFIHQCSYFDYQRDRMSARDIRRLRLKPSRPRRRRKRRVYRNNKIIKVLASRCPACHSKELRSTHSVKRQIVDLKFSGAAIRRWVVLYLSKEYRCQECDCRFIPDGYPRNRTHFGKGLLCWCIYQMVVGGQNLLRIRDSLAKMFGIVLTVSVIYRFKESISFRYGQLYDDLAKSIMSSPVLYIDETTANLRLETGYVWCITDGHSAHYFFKDSREGSFLPDMFKDFGGVLVSDFYTAYDFLECPQQRCLVHLMRDFNEEMQRHPFDSELKVLASRFSTVLKSAVATIDQYGFRRRYLAKHKKTALTFCHWAASCEFASMPAERLRSRIVKYQGQLFTFLDHDGVSWNNTNAEHFIKAFARYRRTANGIFTARSIKEYLVILSIAETSKARGEDFLEFLLRDNKDSFSFESARRVPTIAASEALSAPPLLAG